jgi:hypothetical protein
MGKDRNGKFIAPKGRPSGSGKNTIGLKDAFAVNNPEMEDEIATRYTDNIDEPTPDIHVRHPNRNLSKGEDDEE